MSSNSSGARHENRSGLFSSKSTTHSLNPHYDLVCANSEHSGNKALGFGGILSWWVNHHFASFLWNCESGVGFKVEMLLSTDFHGALQNVVRFRETGLYITAADDMVKVEVRVLFDGFLQCNKLVWKMPRIDYLNSNDVRQLFVLHLH